LLPLALPAESGLPPGTETGRPAEIGIGRVTKSHLFNLGADRPQWTVREAMEARGQEAPLGEKIARLGRLLVAERRAGMARSNRGH